MESYRAKTPMADEKRETTPTDALIEAMEHASEMEDILIMWSVPVPPEPGDDPNKVRRIKIRSSDNDLLISEAIFLVDRWKAAILRACVDPE